jgi:hypothetical protein
LTTPAAGDGTSSVALSDSSVTRLWSFFDRVAGLDQHFDHRHIAVIADVGNLDFDFRHEVFLVARACGGGRLDVVLRVRRAPYSSTRRMSASTCRYAVKRAARRRR